MKNTLIIFLSLIFFSTLKMSGQTISGMIKDNKDSTAISFANIVIEGTTIGTVTDAKGFFHLKTKSIKHRLSR